MNYSEAISFPFQDEKWAKKILTGGLFVILSSLGLVFVTGFGVMGYYIGLLRQVMAGEEKPLPEWNNWPKIFADGLLGGIIAFIYLLIIGGVMAFSIVQLVDEPGLRDAELALTITVVAVVGILSLSVLTNLALARFAATDDFRSAFGFPEMWRLLLGNFGNYLSISVFSLILNGLLFLAGLGIFSPFTNFWGLVVQAHLFGQAARSMTALDPLPSVAPRSAS